MADGLRITGNDRRFFLVTLGLIFLAHATAYLTHEYSHATTAWLLGWMGSPVGIDYGRATVANVLLQQDVGDGVDYAPIFASGHGLNASLIAFDGPGVGNGVLYGMCFLALGRTSVRARLKVAMFLFWLALMNAGNVWSYAPMRTVTTHADMALVARGLGISTWLLLPIVTVPSLLILWSFFFRLLPLVRRTIFARGPAADVFVTLMSCYFYFVFFGNDGLDFSYGETCALLSIASAFIVFPLMTMFCLQAAPRSQSTIATGTAGPLA
ncbi:hypothetical protein [Caulobacter sp. S45]|uniref:hypothetical protein n=1 Tax=Caulobacter sp. S45 TaxID=1641861 RepID=UPI0015769CB8|nr:hypothetical protein [Caulobacter sp. S45]